MGIICKSLVAVSLSDLEICFTFSNSSHSERASGEILLRLPFIGRHSGGGGGEDKVEYVNIKKGLGLRRIDRRVDED